jgi:hypothetical protein
MKLHGILVYVPLSTNVKGTVQRDFLLPFIHERTPPRSFFPCLQAFLIWLRIRGDIRDFHLTLAIVSKEESMLPV